MGSDYVIGAADRMVACIKYDDCSLCGEKHKSLCKSGKEVVSELITICKRLSAERDVAVNQLFDMKDDFVDYVCSGTTNPSDYCENRCNECVDKWGWCIQRECKGFVPNAVAAYEFQMKQISEAFK